jgi:hypothetical protein
MPIITRPCAPAFALEPHQRHAHLGTGGNRMTAHLRGKGMGRVDHMGDPLVLQIGAEPFDAAKAPTRVGKGCATGAAVRPA